MKKRFLFPIVTAALVFCLLAATLTGCGRKYLEQPNQPTTQPVTTTEATTLPPEKDINITQTIEKIIADCEMMKLFPLEDADASAAYNNLDLSLLEEYSFNIPLMNIKCDEITIMKVKNESDIPTVKAAIEERHKVVLSSFEHYLIDQYEIAQKAKVIVNGKYVMFLITENADKGVEIFNKAFE